MKIRQQWKIATREQTLRYLDRIAKDWTKMDAEDAHRADGDRDATRVRLNLDDTPIECNGRIAICAPWAMQWSGAADPVTA